MPYKFTFDLSKVPRFFFTELTLLSYQKGMHKTFLKTAHDLIIKFHIQEATGLNLSDAVVLLQDLIDLQAINIMGRDKFWRPKKGSFPYIAPANTWIIDVKQHLMRLFHLTRVHTAQRTAWLTKLISMPERRAMMFTFYRVVPVYPRY